MYLIHNVFKFPITNKYREKYGLKHYDFLDIIKSGKLRSSSKTKNVGMFGRTKGSKHIFLRIDQKNDIGNLYLDPSFLLNTSFYLQIGWDDGLPNTKKIDGRKLSKEQLEQLLKKFSKEVKKHIIRKSFDLDEDEIIIDDDKVDEKYNKLDINDIKRFVGHSNEILVENNIDLKKYLRKIILTKKLDGYEKKDEIIEIVKQMYPNVEFKDCKRKSKLDDYVCEKLL